MYLGALEFWKLSSEVLEIKSLGEEFAWGVGGNYHLFCRMDSVKVKMEVNIRTKI